MPHFLPPNATRIFLKMETLVRNKNDNSDENTKIFSKFSNFSLIVNIFAVAKRNETLLGRDWHEGTHSCGQIYYAQTIF
jgi:hypothetical protein